jgi:hypothetical protein
MPAAAAAPSCVLPSMSFLRNNLTCASLTMEPHLTPRELRAARTATSGQFNCRQQADLIVVDHAHVRNTVSDAHGRGREYIRLAPRHAELAVNLAGSLAGLFGW